VYNPFKFGSVVEGSFFTNRKDELNFVTKTLASNNHLVIISPRRFGKTSLIKKVISETDRKAIYLDVQLTNTVQDFAAQLLRRIYRVWPGEKLRQQVSRFRVVPAISLNPVSNEVDISFQSKSPALPLLEDVFNLWDRLGAKKNRPIVVLDEFQDIIRLEENLDRKLRAIMQHHQNVNYVMLGSQESLMRDIFEKKKSPFYHFGVLLPLNKISKNHFRKYLIGGFRQISSRSDDLSNEILHITDGHPYYTQQLAYNIWNLLNEDPNRKDVVIAAIEEIIQIHNHDYERLWATFNHTDKQTMTFMALRKDPNDSPLSHGSEIGPSSTVYSSLKRLMLNGCVIKTDAGYELDDPFFKRWIVERRNQ
jgi:AAA+ ATPase superfamily predicted ATPase